MLLSNGKEMLIVGIDFRGAYPEVCFQTGNMKEPQYLPLDFEGRTGRGACYRKVLSALKRFGAREAIRAAVVLPDLSKETMEQNLREACGAGFEQEQIQMISETESFVHFVMRQSADIWNRRVYLLEFQEQEIRAVSLKVNRQTTPMLVEVSDPDYWYVGNASEGSRDEQIALTVKTQFAKEPVSAVFLAGTDLNQEQYRQSREEICFRRRVFLAEQIYARGACVLAGDVREKRNYLFLSEQTLLYNVGIRGSRGRKEQICTLITAGCSWYEAHYSGEMLLLEDPVLEFVFQSMLGGEPIRAGMRLTDLPKRPKGTTRLQVQIHFSDVRECQVMVTDLGFGELYPASDLYWKESFLLKDQEEEDYGTGIDL